VLKFGSVSTRLRALGGRRESASQGAGRRLGETALTPSWAFSRGEPEQNYTWNVSPRVTFHTHSILESLIITKPDYYFNMCHIELQTLGCKLINVDRSKRGIRLAVSPAPIHSSFSS